MIDDEYDFGFSTHTEDEFQPSSEIEEYQARLRRMYDSIIPLLDNLAKDADKNPIIKWPDRGKKIAEFKKKLADILSGKG